MSGAPEDFLRRWSRRKRAAAASMPAAPAVPPPALPPLDGVTFDSDFTAFMHAKVDEAVRRAALKKLFGDPRFNVMDGLDIYIDDYSIEAPIPPSLLAQLEHAKATLLSPQPDEDVAPPAPEPQAALDEDTDAAA